MRNRIFVYMLAFGMLFTLGWGAPQFQANACCFWTDHEPFEHPKKKDSSPARSDGDSPEQSPKKRRSRSTSPGLRNRRASSSEALPESDRVLERALKQQSKDPIPASQRIGTGIDHDELSSWRGNSFGEILDEKATLEDLERLGVGHAAADGSRGNFEDAFTVRGFTHYEIPIKVTGVFDGHGGKEVAQFASRRIFDLVKLELKKLNRVELKRPNSVKEQLFNAFDTIDRDLRKRHDWARLGGSTAVIAVIVGKDLYIINLGDSRAVLAKKDGTGMRLSVDHKPDEPSELKRITDAGGKVDLSDDPYSNPARIDGYSVSGALGDFDNPFMRKTPDLVFIPNFESKGVALILACDGVWDELSDNAVSEYVARNLRLSISPQKIAKGLITAAFNYGSRDNLSALVILF